MRDRIQLTDTFQDAIVKMIEDNPGALSVCIQLIKEGGKIDPDAAFGGFANVLSLDSNRIYGPKIWMLYKDVCNESLIKTIAVLRGHQLGFISSHLLHHAINNYGEGVDINNILIQVKERLPNFNQEGDKNDCTITNTTRIKTIT